MSMTADRLHRNLKRIQRYCTKCGHRMRRAKYKFHPTFDGRTGKREDHVQYYWMCSIADFNAIIVRNQDSHEGWKCHKPNR